MWVCTVPYRRHIRGTYLLSGRGSMQCQWIHAMAAHTDTHETFIEDGMEKGPDRPGGRGRDEEMRRKTILATFQNPMYK